MPTFVIDGRILVGRDDEAHSGADLSALIDEASPASASAARAQGVRPEWLL